MGQVAGAQDEKEIGPTLLRRSVLDRATNDPEATVYNESRADHPVPQERPMPLRVTCTCGQLFTVHAERGPTKVSCFMCGRKFTVDRKSTMSGTDQPHELATAICEKH